MRGAPLGSASIARRTTARSRGRPTVHIPSSRSESSTEKAVHESDPGSASDEVRHTTIPDAASPRTSSIFPPRSLKTYGMGSTGAGSGAAAQRDPPLWPRTHSATTGASASGAFSASVQCPPGRCAEYRADQRAAASPTANTPGNPDRPHPSTSTAPDSDRGTSAPSSHAVAGRTPSAARTTSASRPSTARLPPTSSIAATGRPVCTRTPSSASQVETQSDTGAGIRPPSS